MGEVMKILLKLLLLFLIINQTVLPLGEERFCPLGRDRAPKNGHMVCRLNTIL